MSNRMSKRNRHPKKEIEAAVAYAESQGWRYIKGKNHCWGRLLCPHEDQSGCRISVYGTPKCPEDHARIIVAAIKKCKCMSTE